MCLLSPPRPPSSELLERKKDLKQEMRSLSRKELEAEEATASSRPGTPDGETSGRAEVKTPPVKSGREIRRLWSRGSTLGQNQEVVNLRSRESRRRHSKLDKEGAEGKMEEEARGEPSKITDEEEFVTLPEDQLEQENSA